MKYIFFIALLTFLSPISWANTLPKINVLELKKASESTTQLKKIKPQKKKLTPHNKLPKDQLMAGKYHLKLNNLISMEID